MIVADAACSSPTIRVLQNAVELRQAHWYWLTDLSNARPQIHILPILIILSMFLITQYLTPSPGMDPAQRKHDGLHDANLLRLHACWHYASGLALYWGTSNVINLGIQIGINQSQHGQGDARDRRQATHCQKSRHQPEDHPGQAIRILTATNKSPVQVQA
jgi:membrane protein insertase Oxa1/YidC/SpoIIIJ